MFQIGPILISVMPAPTFDLHSGSSPEPLSSLQLPKRPSWSLWLRLRPRMVCSLQFQIQSGAKQIRSDFFDPKKAKIRSN